MGRVGVPTASLMGQAERQANRGLQFLHYVFVLALILTLQQDSFDSLFTFYYVLLLMPFQVG